MAYCWEKVRMATLSGQHDLAQKLMPRRTAPMQAAFTSPPMPRLAT